MVTSKSEAIIPDSREEITTVGDVESYSTVISFDIPFELPEASVATPAGTIT